MITDDELTAELTRALRERTDHLGYTGPVPRAQRPLAVTVAPFVATAAAAAVLGWSAVTAGAPTTEPGSDGATAGSAHGAPAEVEPRVVTDQIELAGLTVTYTRGADEPSLGGECPVGQDAAGGPGSCYTASWDSRDRVPAGAEEFDVDGTTVWVGEDPATGLAGLYLQADSSVIAILSENRSLEQMRELAATMQLA